MGSCQSSEPCSEPIIQEHINQLRGSYVIFKLEESDEYETLARYDVSSMTSHERHRVHLGGYFSIRHKCESDRGWDYALSGASDIRHRMSPQEDGEDFSQLLTTCEFVDLFIRETEQVCKGVLWNSVYTLYDFTLKLRRGQKLTVYTWQTKRAPFYHTEDFSLQLCDSCAIQDN